MTPQEAQEARQPVEVPAAPEITPNRSQTVTGSQKHRDPRNLPYAFTEHGAIMTANVLNSARAKYIERLRHRNLRYQNL